MSKLSVLFWLIFTICLPCFAQFDDIPSSGLSPIPTIKFKGHVRTVLTVEQDGEEALETTVEVFDMNGRLIEKIVHHASIEVHSGKLMRLGGRTTYVYGENGKVTRTNTFLPNGDFTFYTIYSYDAQNRLIKETSYYKDGKKSREEAYNYFPEKREVEVIWTSFATGNPSKPVKRVLTYNEKLQWAKRTEIDTKGNDTITFDYDEKGNFIRRLHCCENKFAHRFNYKFDNDGNWIERQNIYVEFDENGKEINIAPDFRTTFRVITYYPSLK